MAKLKQIVWFTQDAMINILTISKETGLAENQVIAYIVDKALRDEEFIRKIIEELQEKNKPKGIPIAYPCHLCGKQFLSSHELIKHLYSHIQTKQ